MCMDNNWTHCNLKFYSTCMQMCEDQIPPTMFGNHRSSASIIIYKMFGLLY